MPRGVGARLEEYFRATWAVTNGIHEDKVIRRIKLLDLYDWNPLSCH